MYLLALLASLVACVPPSAAVPPPDLQVVVLGDRTGEPDDRGWRSVIARVGWDGVQAAARIHADGWAAEARIPWVDLGLSGPPPTLRLDARRKQERTQAEATWTPGFWSSDIDRMGTVVLSGR